MTETQIEYEAHPLSSIMPEMEGRDYLELRADIGKTGGLLEPITLWEGKILDGRHRYRACQELNLEPKFKDFHQNGISAMDYVISQNLKRRHLTIAQRAAIALKLKDSLLSARGRIPGEPVREHVARVMNVSIPIVSMVSTIRKKSPELFAKIEAGKIGTTKAWRQCKAKYEKAKPPKQFKTDTEALTALIGLGVSGWNLEMRRNPGGRWKAHLYGNGEQPFSDDLWKKCWGRSSIAEAIEQAVLVLSDFDYV